MIQLLLYSTSACHLCELALDIIEPLIGSGCSLQVVDISESNDLMERYGIRIPVVRRMDTNVEIDWPFDAVAFARFLEGAPHP